MDPLGELEEEENYGVDGEHDKISKLQDEIVREKTEEEEEEENYGVDGEHAKISKLQDEIVREETEEEEEANIEENVEFESKEKKSGSLSNIIAESESSFQTRDQSSVDELSEPASQLGFLADDEQTLEEFVSEQNYFIQQLQAITKRFKDLSSDGDDAHHYDELIDSLTDLSTENHKDTFSSALGSYMKRSSMIRSISYPGNYFGEEHDDSGIEGEGETEDFQLTILDPEHPLMQRFQTAYKDHLEKQKEKITLEIQSLENELKGLSRMREDKGELLYNVQQELAKLQSHLEQVHSEQHSLAEQRMSLQEHLLISREKHKKMVNLHNEMNAKALNLRAELSRWDLVLHFMNQFNMEMKTDVGVIRCAAEKGESNFLQLQLEKKRQDVVIKKKMEEINHLEEMLNLYTNHCISQEDELTGAHLTLAESQMQIECVEMEKKQIFQQWKNSLNQLEQKDDLLRTLNEAMRETLNEIVTRDRMVSLLRKEVDKEMELNEILTLTRERTERICSNVSKEIDNLKRKLEITQQQYNEKLRVLKETEKVIQSTIKENNNKKEDENHIQKKLENLTEKHNNLEDKIMDLMMEHMLQQKADKYCMKMTSKLREKTRQLLTNLVKLENEYSSLILKHTNSTVRCERLTEMLKNNNREVEEVNNTVKGIENMISRHNLTISKKQVTINTLSGRLEELIHTAGGDEITPLEAHIRYLDKTIDEKTTELQNQKANWLRRQTDLVFTTQKIDQTNESCIQMNRRYYIMQNKKQRIDGRIEEEEKEIHRTELNIKKHQTVIIKNNEKLGYEKGIQENLAADAILMENNVIYTLKDAELENIQLQEKIENIQNEKKRLESKLIEAQQQVMLWEKKIQLAKEAKALVSSEEVAGETQTMRWEIHRMQVRYNQLRRQQEILIQESEKLIGKRENIISRNENQNKMVKKLITKTSAQKTIEELKKKIKQVFQESHVMEDEISKLNKELSESGKEVDTLNESVHNLKSQAENLEKSIRLTERKFQKNFQQLVALQTGCKYLQAIREGKYKKVWKADENVESELQKQLAVAQKLQDVIVNYAEKTNLQDELIDLAARHSGRIDAVI